VEISGINSPRIGFFSRFSAIFINLLKYEREQAHRFYLLQWHWEYWQDYFVHKSGSPESIQKFAI
jgi:hypothetical protein